MSRKLNQIENRIVGKMLFFFLSLNHLYIYKQNSIDGSLARANVEEICSIHLLV